MQTRDEATRSIPLRSAWTHQIESEMNDVKT